MEETDLKKNIAGIYIRVSRRSSKGTDLVWENKKKN